jgi:hypothetical protein
LEDVRIVPVETPLSLDAAKPAVIKVHLNVMAFSRFNKAVPPNQSLILQEKKHTVHEVALDSLGGRLLAPKPFNCAPKQARLLKGVAI